MPEFDHYAPAQYLFGLNDADADALGLDETLLDRFEDLFEQPNASVKRTSAKRAAQDE